MTDPNRGRNPRPRVVAEPRDVYVMSAPGGWLVVDARRYAGFGDYDAAAAFAAELALHPPLDDREAGEPAVAPVAEGGAA